MGAISNKWDPVNDKAPAPDSGTLYFDHPGLKPSAGAIKETPGEKETNETGGLSYNKGQPFGKGGSGYTKSG